MQSDSEEGIFQISVKGNGLSIDQSVDKTIALDIINILMGEPVGHTDSRVAQVRVERDTQDRKATKSQLPDADKPSRRLSLREFLNQSEAKRMPDKILVICEYMSQYKGIQEFTRDDVKARFREAGEGESQNFGRDFNWAVSNGWIARGSVNGGKYYVTNTGKTAIDEKFSLKIRKATRQKPKKSRKSPARRKATSISTSEEGI